MVAKHSFKGEVHFSPNFRARPKISHVVFDFDGTLSLVRGGWAEVMVQMFLDLIPREPGEEETLLRAQLLEELLRLNGKPTIHQMIHFAGLVKHRHGKPQTPEWYNAEYQRRLGEKITHRRHRVESGKSHHDELLVFGARKMLEKLRQRGLQLHLVSGTELHFLQDETKFLKLDHFFGEHIYGPSADLHGFTKKAVMQQILTQNKLSADQFLSFGDGFVEIENTKELGGLAVAVASDELNNGSGEMDLWKQERLAAAGADVVIPDYRDADALLAAVFGASA